MATDNENHFYSKSLQPNANNLRKTMTKAEACLWKYVLKAGRIKGYQFRRQRPVLTYIADFMCMPLMLIIEVDGFTHSFEGAEHKDQIRERQLMEAGFTILRFRDEEVLTSIEAVDQAIRTWVDTNEHRFVHPLPPPAGDIGAR